MLDRWSYFRDALLEWYEPGRRPMPWKGQRDPYRIWLSEIILQQTRVEQGWVYYERFAAAYPTVTDLAAAEDDAVMKLWEGLGYYSRARNLLKAARMVESEFAGSFPASYKELLKLPGVGPYTAAAVASFAYDEPVAVLDGNVFRVLARYAGVATPIDTTAGKKEFTRLAGGALGQAAAATYNQAIMDFGATVCTPKAPACPTCPLQTACEAFGTKRVQSLPVKSKKPQRRDRFFHYLVLEDGAGRAVLRQRTEKDIWQGLFDFPLVETSGLAPRLEELPNLPDWPSWLPAGEIEPAGQRGPYKQLLTHQTIYATFHLLTWTAMPGSLPDFTVISNKLLKEFAFPKIINRFLAERRLHLTLF